MVCQLSITTGITGSSAFVVSIEKKWKDTMALYRSERVGKSGKIFSMYKIQTLDPGGGSFAHEREYVRGGRFMRKFRIDELPQLWNILKGDMGLFGIRPKEPKEIDLYPEDVRNKILSKKPGLFSLSGIYFMDEEHILKHSLNSHQDYFNKVLPMKLALDMFYIDNRCWLLNASLIWMAIKARLKNKND